MPRGLHADQPLRVAAIGGGTGLAALLRALKYEAGRSRDPWRLTGIVTVSDNGGSSGRLRAELGGIPPGDLRNCLSALTREESLLSELLNYRFKGEGALAGHSLGLSAVIANSALLPDPVLRRYLDEGGAPLLPVGNRTCGVPVFVQPLLDPEEHVARHHPSLLNRALRDVIESL